MILHDLPAARATGAAAMGVSVTPGIGGCGVVAASATPLFRLTTNLSRTDSVKRTAAADRVKCHDCTSDGHAKRVLSCEYSPSN